MPGIKNNKNAQKHGGEAAIKAIQMGDHLRGLAAKAENNVHSEFILDGHYSLVVRNATRLQAAADLFWDAILGAAEEGDLERLDRYVKRFGWLASSALRAWSQVKNESRKVEIDASHVLEAIQGDENR